MPRFGLKKIYLPNFTVALRRTPHLPPTFAQFQVPLNLNKLDLRDYLRHAYGVDALNIRSYIIQQTVKQKSRTRKWYRSRSIKRMTVEMEKPFVYPPEPEDLSPWDKEMFDALDKARRQSADTRGPMGHTVAKEGKREIRELATKMMEVEGELKVPSLEDVEEDAKTRL